MKVESHPAEYAWEKRFPQARLVKGYEGGAIFAADHEGKYYIITDEGTMADFLMPGEDDDVLARLITIAEYDSQSERDQQLRKYQRKFRTQ